jgi:Flp pilus assembly protein TadB
MKFTLALAILAMILWVGTFLYLTPPLAAVIVTLAAIVMPSFERWRRRSG